MLAITAIVGWQVWGRYVLNDTPIAAERLTILLLLYIALLGAAAGVREQFHLGMTFVRDGLSAKWQRALDIANHLLVGCFAAGMAWYGSLLALSTASHSIPTVGISEAFTYLPVPISGVATLLFVAEHIAAILAGRPLVARVHGGGVE